MDGDYQNADGNCCETLQTVPIVKWKRLNPGTCKLNNYDVAIGVDGKVGYGFSLRNELGRIVIAEKIEKETVGSITIGRDGDDMGCVNTPTV